MKVGPIRPQLRRDVQMGQRLRQTLHLELRHTRDVVCRGMLRLLHQQLLTLNDGSMPVAPVERSNDIGVQLLGMGHRINCLPRPVR